MFLLDQSRSMSHKLAGQQTSKAKEATDAINRQIYEIIYRCTKTEGVRDYFEIGIIGYGSKSDTAESLLPNSTGVFRGKDSLILSRSRINMQLSPIESDANFNLPAIFLI